MELRNASDKMMYVYENDINKYHREIKGFKGIDIFKIQKYLLENCKKFSFRYHFLERKEEKEVPTIDTKEILKHGSCFEYKMVGDKLYRFALRVSGSKDKDYVFVLEPFTKRNGEVQVDFVTCYANFKRDTHRTLCASNYTK